MYSKISHHTQLYSLLKPSIEFSYSEHKVTIRSLIPKNYKSTIILNYKDTKSIDWFLYWARKQCIYGRVSFVESVKEGYWSNTLSGFKSHQIARNCLLKIESIWGNEIIGLIRKLC